MIISSIPWVGVIQRTNEALLSESKCRGEMSEKQIFRPQALYQSALPMTYNEAVKVALLRWFCCLWFVSGCKTKLQVLFDSKVSRFLANEEDNIK